MKFSQLLMVLSLRVGHQQIYRLYPYTLALDPSCLWERVSLPVQIPSPSQKMERINKFKKKKKAPAMEEFSSQPKRPKN